MDMCVCVDAGKEGDRYIHRWIYRCQAPGRGAQTEGAQRAGQTIGIGAIVLDNLGQAFAVSTGHNHQHEVAGKNAPLRREKSDESESESESESE